MSKYKVIELWNERYGEAESLEDYAGNLMFKSACGNFNSSYEPVICYIRPISLGGKDIKGNIIICHRDTNYEKNNNYPHWKVKGDNYYAKRVKGSKNNYKICNERKGEKNV